MGAGIPIFRPGDMILVGHVEQTRVRASIAVLRHATADARATRTALGCDVITETGECRFYFMNDICRWNPGKIKEAFP